MRWHNATITSREAKTASDQALQNAAQALLDAQQAREATQHVDATIRQAVTLAQQELNNMAQAQIAAIQANAAQVEHEYNRLHQVMEDVHRLDLEKEIQVQRANITEKHRLGIFEQEEKIRAQASIDTEAVKWDKIQSMIDDPKRIIKIVLAITTIGLGIYAAKYIIPEIIHSFTQPQVISETSKRCWFDWCAPQQSVALTDLTFTPLLQKQLFDLALRVQSAKTYRNNLPNLLFYGVPGTGKTAFAKALAYHSGLDYALTSGSEFTKITDANLANNELRKLLAWAQDSPNGLIIFIDEAESLFANRAIPSTSKTTQDFINTFLALIPDKSQKNVMFIFATNHPFKLDDAIINRIGTSIEFTLPGAPERERILATYLVKFSHEHDELIIDLHPEFMKNLTQYAVSLEGLCPRAIKFIAQEMIACARQQDPPILTDEIAQTALTHAQASLQHIAQWQKERDQWALAQMGSFPLRSTPRFKIGALT